MAEVDVVDGSVGHLRRTSFLTVQVIERSRAARAREDAAAVHDREGISGAKQVLERRSEAVRANAHLVHETIRALEAVSNEAIQKYASEPCRAKKTSGVESPELTR